METLTNCPICNHDKFKPFLSCVDYTVSHETFRIVQCEACGFRFTNPRPDEKEIKKYYQSEEYISHSDTSKGLVNKLYKIARNYTIKKKIKLINRIYFTSHLPPPTSHLLTPNPHLPTPHLLDMGCGTGEFLNRCKKYGWEVTGIEPSETARKKAEEKFGLSTYPSLQALSSFFLENEQSHGFNVITLWHVLEHIHQLEKTIKQFHNILCDDGILIIAIPNSNCYDAKKYGEHWAAYDLPRHLYHFTKKDIESLIEKQGFKLSEIIPMKFDSYYISLLSEKNKTGHANLFKGFWNGWVSNVFSTKNNRGYSSQIYIFHKK